MITEFITSLLTPAPKWSKHMGFLNESIAIEARARRCREVWKPHQQKTKESILDAIKACDRTRTILVVGSGSCLDIPLTELARIFERVILVDIIHPLKAKKHGFNHVTHITLDITGQMEALYHNPTSLPEFYVPDLYHDFSDIDFVLSLNLASQLPIMPIKYLMHKSSLDENILNQFAKNLIKAHFLWLSGFKCPTALICDKTWEKLDLSGKTIEIDDPLYGLIPQKNTWEWYWDVAPAYETGTEFTHRNRVGYWSNFRFIDSDNIIAWSDIQNNKR